MRRSQTNQSVVFENLEGRALMSGTPLAVTQVAMAGGTELQITATAANCKITVTQTNSGLLIGDTGGWSQVVSDAISSLSIKTAGGTNSVMVSPSVALPATIVGGSGKNTLAAGSGATTLVCLGSSSDMLSGGAGRDTFWMDASNNEKVRNAGAGDVVHRVGSFYNGAPSLKVTSGRAARVSAVKEPAISSDVHYANFSNDPIFSSNGPSENDVYQGNLGDCYYLSVLSSVAKTDPACISQSMLNLGDGTAIVQLYKNGSPVYVRETEQLPVNTDGSLAYASLGQQNCTWVALMEKAFCYVRGGAVSYATIEGGWMSEAYSALGASATSSYSFNSASDLTTTIASDLAAHQSVTYATIDNVGNNAALISDHAYTVDHVNFDGHGNVASVTLRNPWGVNNDGTGDGYVTVSATVLFHDLVGLVAANV